MPALGGVAFPDLQNGAKEVRNPDRIARFEFGIEFGWRELALQDGFSIVEVRVEDAPVCLTMQQVRLLAFESAESFHRFHSLSRCEQH